MGKIFKNFTTLDYLVLTLVLVISIFFCLWNLGSRPLGAHNDEAINSTIAYHIFQSGDFLHPTYKNRPYVAQPPLKIWLTAIGLKLFGTSNFVYRLWDGLAGIALAVTVFFFARLLFTSTLAAFCSVLLLFTSNILLFKYAVRISTQDTVFAFLLTLAFFKLWQVYQDTASEQFSKRKVILSGLCIGSIIGCAFLVKSVTALLPLIIASLFCAITSISTKKINYSYFSIIIVAGFIAVLFGASWYLPHILDHRVSLANLLGYNSGNNTSFSYYFDKLYHGHAGSIIVISLSTLWLAYSWFKDKTRAHCLYLLLWGCGIFFIVSCFSLRLERFLIPVIPAFAIAGGGFFTWLYNQQLSKYTPKTFSRIQACLILCIIICAFAPVSTLYKYSRKIYLSNGSEKFRSDDIERIVKKDFKRSASLIVFQQPRRKPTLSGAEHLYIEMMEISNTTTTSLDAAIAHLKAPNTRLALVEDAYGLELLRRFPELPCIEYRLPRNHSWRRRGFLVANEKPANWPHPRNRCLEYRGTLEM